MTSGGTSLHPSASHGASENARRSADAGRRWTGREMGAVARSGEQTKQRSAAPSTLLRTGRRLLMGHRSHSVIRAQIAYHHYFRRIAESLFTTIFAIISCHGPDSIQLQKKISRLFIPVVCSDPITIL